MGVLWFLVDLQVWKKKQMMEIVCKEIEDNAAFSDYDDFHNSSSLAELKSIRAIQYNTIANQ